jgi:hypothetical protein
MPRQTHKTSNREHQPPKTTTSKQGNAQYGPQNSRTNNHSRRLTNLNERNPHRDGISLALFLGTSTPGYPHKTLRRPFLAMSVAPVGASGSSKPSTSTAEELASLVASAENVRVDVVQVSGLVRGWLHGFPRHTCHVRAVPPMPWRVVIGIDENYQIFW